MGSGLGGRLAELAAGGGDVLASGAAEVGDDVVVAEGAVADATAPGLWVGRYTRGICEHDRKSVRMD